MAERHEGSTKNDSWHSCPQSVESTKDFKRAKASPRGAARTVVLTPAAPAERCPRSQARRLGLRVWRGAGQRGFRVSPALESVTF